jgi:hypothetical protein
LFEETLDGIINLERMCTMVDEKPELVKFKRGVTSKEILDHIHGMQDEWAAKNPEEAHRLYPTVYDEAGKRIKKEGEQ